MPKKTKGSAEDEVIGYCNYCKACKFVKKGGNAMATVDSRKYNNMVREQRAKGKK